MPALRSAGHVAHRALFFKALLLKLNLKIRVRVCVNRKNLIIVITVYNPITLRSILYDINRIGKEKKKQKKEKIL